MKIISFLLIMVFISACTNALSYKEAANMNIDREQAIKMANQFLSERKYDLNNKNINLDDSNSKWKEFSSNERFMASNIKTLSKLEGKDYWAVNFYPKEKLILGGEAWVFVDKHNGEVILFFKLK